MTSARDDHVKVHFRLAMNEDGWPPTRVESLWAVDLGDGTVRLDNTPWFVRGVAGDDIIRVEVDEDGVRWAGETVRASENCTIRLVVLKDGGSEAARQTVLETFHRLGTTGEGIEQFRMVALDVPPDADLPGIRKLLEHGEAKGWWHWEEGASQLRGRRRKRSSGAVSGQGQTDRMTASRNYSRHLHADLAWVQSMGGPLIVIPASAVDQWGGCTEDGIIVGGSDVPDDYDRACDVEGWAGIIDVGAEASGLVLADEPATTCYLSEQNVFVRWLAADSDAELLLAARAVLDDPATGWEDCGVWESDGPAVLLDSAQAGADLAVEYPDQGGLPEQAQIPVPAGRWSVRATHKTGDFPWVGVVQLLPA